MFSREIGLVPPETVGIDSVRLARAVDILRSGVGSAFPGATVCAFRQNRCFLDLALGTHGGSSPARLESVYDLASLTKPMATASSVLTLAERGQLAYTDTLETLLGADAGDWKAVTVKQLVTHTSGLPAWLPLYKSGLGLDSAVQTTLAMLAADRPKPGTAYEYSCLNYILLGKIVQTVSGKPLDAFARDTIFAPMGLLDTTYRPDTTLLSKRIAPTQSEEGMEDAHPVTLCGTVHDGNARGIQEGGDVSGNAGLFGSARDVARFGNAFLHPGETRLFGSPTLSRVFENQIHGVGGQSLLFYTAGNGYNPAGDLLSPRTVGHSGYTGTMLAIDPEYDLAVAVLTNCVYPVAGGAGRPGWLAIRRRFLNALAAAL